MRPLTRGYIHQLAFFVACGACLVLVTESYGDRALTSNIIYSLTLIGLYGVSSLYHCREWNRRQYLVMRRLDHAAIYALIVGTATPICLLGLQGALGIELLLVMWLIATFGILVTLLWTHAPKWTRAFFYVALGWLHIITHKL